MDREERKTAASGDHREKKREKRRREAPTGAGPAPGAWTRAQNMASASPEMPDRKPLGVARRPRAPPPAPPGTGASAERSRGTARAKGIAPK